MPSVRIRLKASAPEDVRINAGSAYGRSFSKKDSPNTWTVDQAEYDKFLKSSGLFELVPPVSTTSEKIIEAKLTSKATHFDVGRIK